MKTTLAPRSLRSLRLRSSPGIICLGAVAALCTASCAAVDSGSIDDVDGEKLGSAESALFGNTYYWPTGEDGISEVPVCWKFSGYDSDKEYVRTAIEGQWGAVSSLRFTGWGICDASTPTNAIRIDEEDNKDNAPHSGVGTTGYGVSMTLNFTYSAWNSYTRVNCDCPWYDTECVFHSKEYYGEGCDYCSDNHAFCNGLIGLHEFGHALGFWHEQDRPDNSGKEYCDDTVVTRTDGEYLTSSYDTDSIMNYCSIWSNTVPEISPGDITGVIAAYGSKPSTLTEQVLIYRDTAFSGAVQALYPGDYNESALTIGNDALNSLRIPLGWSVQLFADANFSGRSMTLGSDEANLDDVFSGVSFNDMASSISVKGPSIQYPVIYKNIDYSGASLTLHPGVYSSSDDLGDVGNDNVSSISVPSGWTVTLYADANFGGASVEYYGFSSSDVGSFNDKATSIRVVGPTGSNPAVIYKDENYRGQAQALWPGRYQASDLSIGNDELTSLSVPTGWTVILMQNSPFGGERREYTSNNASLVGDGFNDQTSSIIVVGPN